MTGLPIAAIVALGLLFFATPLIVLILVLALLSLRARVKGLEARLTVLEGRPAGPGRAPSPEPGPVETQGAPPPPAPPAPAPAVLPDAPPPVAPPAGGLSPGAESAAGAPGPSEGRAAPGVGAWEGRLGGTWLSRVGAILLIVGVGFFLKHAFEHEWIGPRGRVLAGVAAGLLMLGGGARLARGGAYQVPAQSLVAAGLGVLYLSLYTAYALYALVPAMVSFVAMAAVTAVGFATALRLDSRPLAVLATVGGLLAPIILETDADAPMTVLTYLLILDLGVLVAASRRGWSGVVLLAYAGTQALYWSWLGRWYEAHQLRAALGWATAFFVAFAGGALLGSRVPRPPAAVQLSRTVLILGVPALYFAAVRRVLDDPAGRRLALLALGLAALYWVGGRAAAGRAWGGPRVALLHRAVALAFLALAPAVTLGRHDLVIAWSVEGLVLLAGGFALSAPRLRTAGLVISALAWSRWLAAVEQDAGQAGTFLVAHPALPATLAVALTAGLGALVYRRRELAGAALGPWERAVRPALLVVAVGSLAFLVTVELGQFRTLAIPPAYVPVVKSVVWILATMVLLALSRGDGTRLLLVVASVLLVALIGEAVGGTDAWARLQPSLRPAVRNPRFLAGCLLVVLVWLYGQVAGSLPYLGEQTRHRLRTLGAVGAALLLLWNLSIEVVLAPLPETRFDPAKLRGATLSVLWAVYAFTVMAWGLWRNHAALRGGAIVLFCVTVLKVLVVDLAGLDALYRILSVVVLGALLLLASFLYARARRQAT